MGDWYTEFIKNRHLKESPLVYNELIFQVNNSELRMLPLSLIQNDTYNYVVVSI